MHAFLNLGEVLQLPTGRGVRSMTNLRAAADKRAADTEYGYRAVAQLLRAVMRKLKPRFVDGGRVQYGRLSNLKDVRGETRVERALWQRKAIYAAVL